MPKMSDIDRYIQAATRDNTRRSYRSAIEHYEVQWGGFLPATADAIVNYLVAYAALLATSTLRQRLAALAQWHIDQGFPDPTKTPQVKKVLRGIQVIHLSIEKRAKPLQIGQLDLWFIQQLHHARAQNNQTEILRCLGDRALVLLGFWRGFRGDELQRLQIEHVTLFPGEGMTMFLTQTKTDRQSVGTLVKAPVLARLCPVTAYQDWIESSQLTEGPVFRAINRWGTISQKGMNTLSFIQVLRSVLARAGIVEVESYSGHSLRRGFATWANANGWDVKALMEYVGWKDIKSAMRYIDGADTYAQYRINNALAQSLTLDTTPKIAVTD
jgi:integrase